MNNFIESRSNMSDAEWEMYEKHLEKRAKEEQQKIDLQRNIQLRKFEIERILKVAGDRFTREQLEKKSLNTLMMIFLIQLIVV